MATEIDCVSCQGSLSPSSDVTHSSVLSTPELTPHSSCASSIDDSESEGSFFSAPSHVSIPLHPTKGEKDSQELIADAAFTNMGLPVRVEFPSGIPAFGESPLCDSTVLSSALVTRRPRKLRKSRPHVPSLSIDSCIPGLESLATSQSPLLSISPSAALDQAFLKRGRRSSLPTIPSATLYPADKLNDDQRGEEFGSANLRAVRFVTPLGSHSKPLHGPRSPHPSILARNASTHVLVSLAWTGRIPSSVWSPHPTSATESLGSPRSTWSEDEDGVANNASAHNPHQRSRRWSLATAITSDEISDEMFVDEVEKMRTRGKFWESVKSSGPSPQPKHTLPRLSDPLLSATWQTARRTLLICRELIRTERNYLASLCVLVSNGTVTPAPSLMLTYVPALLQASEDLLLKMEGNPSAQGVAEAFVEGSSALENALVAWCGVSGSFFTEKQIVRERAVSSRVPREMPSTGTIPLKRRVTTWVQSRRDSLSLKSESVAGILSGKPNEPSRGSRCLPTVRDLAILPVQRVMRYPLLFRDLLVHIPSSSPSHVCVERCLHVAMAIAQKSDRAQGNAAFLQQTG
ncbi:hypothetical protein C8R47DRAFT_794104 [Mycena vitilis]|nr:hypothetical protein C8R47DRAFT_794104 [Mycena vitilis]